MCIEGREVKWIDAKLFFGAASITMDPALDGVKGTPLCGGSMRKYSGAYTDAFGPGALIFYHGFSSSLPAAVPGVLMLDGGPINNSAVDAVCYRQAPAAPAAASGSGRSLFDHPATAPVTAAAAAGGPLFGSPYGATTAPVTAAAAGVPLFGYPYGATTVKHWRRPAGDYAALVMDGAHIYSLSVN